MKLRLLSFFAALLLFTAASAKPVIKFEETVHDFGTIDKNKLQTCEFVFTNTGDEPLVIHQAYGACGCTVGSVPTSKINPGEKGTIKVTFDGKNKPNGKDFKVLVTVRSNATNSMARIYVKGKIK